MFIPLKDENPTSRFPYITVLLIIINIAVFFYQILSPEGLPYYVYKMGAIPYEITHFQSLSSDSPLIQQPINRLSPWLTLVTSLFLHGSVIHLFGNMLYLWIFGNNVEDFLGSFRFLFFYLISGLGASLVHIGFNSGSRVPVIGASGAIAGVLGAYMILYPQARVLTLIFLFIFIRVVFIPAFIVLGIWFILQIMNVGLGGGVAWFAHIGGFLLGIFLVQYYIHKRKRMRAH